MVVIVLVMVVVLRIGRTRVNSRAKFGARICSGDARRLDARVLRSSTVTFNSTIITNVSALTIIQIVIVIRIIEPGIFDVRWPDRVRAMRYLGMNVYVHVKLVISFLVIVHIVVSHGPPLAI